MASDVMSVRLWLPRIKVLGGARRRARGAGCFGVLDGAAAEVLGLWEACVRVHDRRDNKIRDLEVSGRPVTLVRQR